MKAGGELPTIECNFTAFDGEITQSPREPMDIIKEKLQKEVDEFKTVYRG